MISQILSTLKHFVARRGIPEIIISDKLVMSYVDFSKRKILKLTLQTSVLSKINSFIPEHLPHLGGLLEAVKCLNSVITLQNDDSLGAIL